MPRLTKRLIDTTPPPATGDVTLWDEQVPGFGCRLWASGRKSFSVRYRYRGRQMRLTLGPYGVLTVDQARAMAQAALGQLAMGADPASVRRSRSVSITVVDLASRYLTEHAVPKKKARSVAEDRANLRKHILPVLGKRAIADITPRDITALHHSLRATPIAANRCLSLLSTIFSLAEQWELCPRGSNPVVGIQRYKERKRERYLSLEELARLSQVLTDVERDGEESPAVVRCIRLLLLTGCRLLEVLTLRWDALNLSAGTARLVDSKTGPRTVYLAPPAAEILQATPHTSPWVIPGRTVGQHHRPPHHAWHRIRTKAGLEDVRLHDLRHTYASLGVQAGLSLPLIGGLLGHRSVGMVQRYAHLADSPQHQAAALIGELMRKAMGGE